MAAPKPHVTQEVPACCDARWALWPTTVAAGSHSGNVPSLPSGSPAGEAAPTPQHLVTRPSVKRTPSLQLTAWTWHPRPKGQTQRQRGPWASPLPSCPRSPRGPGQVTTASSSAAGEGHLCVPARSGGSGTPALPRDREILSPEPLPLSSAHRLGHGWLTPPDDHTDPTTGPRDPRSAVPNARPSGATADAGSRALHAQGGGARRPG